MKAEPPLGYNYIKPGVWLSIHDLAIAMHRTVRWIRDNLRQRVPHTPWGDVDYFFTDDVIEYLANHKIEARE